MHRSLEASQSHTSNHSRISSRREWERVVNALGCVCPMVGQQQMKGEVRGYKYPPPKTSPYCVVEEIIKTSSVRSELLTTPGN
jgi:hypothetical protein